MLPPAGLTSGSIHLSAYRGAPVTSAMTFQDEKRAHAYEKAHSAMLPLLAPLVSQTPIEDKQYARCAAYCTPSSGICANSTSLIEQYL